MLDKELFKLPGIKQIMILLAGLAFLQALFINIQAWSLVKAISGLWHGQSLEAQIPWIITFLIVFVLKQVVQYYRDQKLDNFAYDRSQEIREALLEKVFRLGPQVVQKYGTGNVTTMTLDGINQVENYLKLILAKVVNMMIVPWIILLVLLYLDLSSGLILFSIYPLIIIFMIILGFAAQAKADRQYASYQLLSNHFIDSLRGIDTLKLFGMSKIYGKSIFKTSERFRRATVDTLKIAILSTFALDFFTTLSIAIVAVLLGVRLIKGEAELFPALTVLTLAPDYFMPIRDFASDYHATLDGKNAMTAIMTILNQAELEEGQTPIKTWQADSSLQLDAVDFSYETDEKLALNQVRVSATGFQKIGLIGMSGSGKSTLINMLSGFTKPDQGSITVDGQTVDHLFQSDWQEQIIYIPQSPYIFQLSLRDNIRFYAKNASDAQVQEAVVVVGLEDLVSQLPDGLDTILGDGGRSLSGGQAQRIALARAFLDKSRRILLFDEPTAHLDIETEIELKERMLPLMEDRLVIFATHRMHWMENMDRIYVLDQGQIVASGTLDDLIADTNGPFMTLAQGMRGDLHA
ncbi:thiol reductant ABC exporter subunit CydD [Aerococcus sp. 1KP-2016]|uniref:thiol reductant ABC exporter subunit CydD n=1 Tax=Aerococcus sp. 1KP-2016 TaxID=1981982 RepID=UPI000B990065|nr:thiol reductant ABC exporter subunit CydD [Aerococcus sp. 1KP-2016]OYQ66885.1 thiol reductant ABC exporter subunit CydD [Aerococcus sp. 1KP-2016]